MTFWQFGDKERERNEKRGSEIRQPRWKTREAMNKNDSWNFKRDLATKRLSSFFKLTFILKAIKVKCGLRKTEENVLI